MWDLDFLLLTYSIEILSIRYIYTFSSLYYRNSSNCIMGYFMKEVTAKHALYAKSVNKSGQKSVYLIRRIKIEMIYVKKIEKHC
jgi:hypothetical protein